MNYNMQEFIDYVLMFYGPGEIDDLNFSEDEVKKAVRIHILDGKVEFAGDSVDREMVRDIVLDEIRA